MRSYETLTTVWEKTLAYSDIFDYPLKAEEIFRYALTSTPVTAKIFDAWLQKNHTTLQDRYQLLDDYWTKNNSTQRVENRRYRTKLSQKRLRSAKIITTPLLLIPGLHFIGVTGAVAAGNTTEHDDIDLFVITTPRRLWLTRFLLLSYLILIKKRYSTSSPRKGNTYCLNHILTTDQLTVSPDLYLANDIARMKVLWNKQRSYEAFLQTNAWIKEYLANWWGTQAVPHIQRKQKRISLPFTLSEEWKERLQKGWFIISAPIRTPLVFFSWLTDGLELITKQLQLRHLRRQQPHLHDEHRLQYHLHDNREWILREYYLAVGRIKGK